MKVITDAGQTFDLGTVQTAPKIEIIDYSRRVTDDFGVTTVVERGFARRMSLMLGVPTDQLDTVQRQVAALRGKAARWIADDRFTSLTMRGFFKDFSVDLPGLALSFCQLTVESLVDTEPFVDPGLDPAIEQASTLRLLQPIAIDGAAFVSSTIPENDAAEWSASATYALGARVMKAATHRVYESAIAGNIGEDPAALLGKWIDVGPTNRWAMFDQALGSTSTATGSISVTLTGALINAVALLDVVGATVRIQATNLDRTVKVGAGAVTILDLPGKLTRVTVTLTGAGSVSIGTLLVGRVVGLGVTETSPSVGIIDYSRKDVDDFGEVTLVERAWAKSMRLGSMIASSAVDVVVCRLAAVRARPSLWIGEEGLDSLTVYGFFKDFSLEVGETTSKLSLAIEGLSAATPVAPIGGGGGSTAWPDIPDPDGTKPANNADKTSENTSKDTAAVGGKPAGQVLGDIDSVAARANALETVAIPAVNKAVADASTAITAARGVADAAKTRADAAFVEIGTRVTEVNERIDSISQSGGYDDSQVKASIDQVDKAAIGRDAALAESVRTVDASLTTTDKDLRALVTSKEQAAVGREDAISRRVDDLIAQGGGGSDGVDSTARSEVKRVEQASIGRDNALGTRIDTVTTDYRTRDTNTNARITDEALASSNRDQALASRSSVLEATASASSGSAVFNDNFAFWPDGQALPSRWGIWSAGGNFRTQRLSPGRGGGLYCVRTLNDVANVDSGFVQVIYTAGPGKWVVEVTIDKVNGSLNGAGVTLSGAWNLDFCSDPDTNGKIGDSADGEIRSWSKMFDLDARDQINVHAMHGWSGFGRTIYAKALTWHCLRLRPATDGEIKAGKADAALNNPGGVLARIKSSEDTLADLPNRYGAASKVATLEAQVNFAADSGLQRTVNSRIEDRATAIADAKAGAVAQTVSILRGEYDGTVSEVRDQRGVINGLNGKAAAYVKILADAGNGVAALSLWSDQYGGAWELAGNGRIRGNLVLDGTLTGAKIAPDAISGFAFFNGNGGSVTFSTTAAKTIASIGYAGNGGNSSLTVSGVITLGPQAPAGTRLSMYISLSGSVILGPIPISAQRGSPVPFSYTTSTSFTGSRTIELTVQATGASGSGDPHIVDSPTIILTEFKKLGA